MEFTIGKRKIGQGHPPFLIAELSGNHNQSLERCMRLVEAAKEAGADAIKLQTYTADTITWPGKGASFEIEDEKSLWYKKNLYDLYSEASLPWSWHEAIFKKCEELEIICFSSPFDETAVEFLEALQQPPPCYKIASPEIIDLPLIKKVAVLGKPIIISTGAASFLEIAQAVDAVKNENCPLILLKCTAAYPARATDANLRTIAHMAETFQTLAGLSDHTLGTAVAVASVAMGASVIEKHFTLDRSEGGVDSAFSLEPHEFKKMAQEVYTAWSALGSVSYGMMASEKVSHSHRPSLFFVEDLKAGTMITKDHIRSLRPFLGLSPAHYETILGLTLSSSVQKGTPIQWNHFKQ